MCGRFSLQTPINALVNLFDGLSFPHDYHPRKQIAPTQQVLCIRQHENKGLEVVWLQWGLIPSWAKDAKIGSKMINARSETVGVKPAFRSAVRKRRCLILADAFYEWKKEGAGKQAYRIHPVQGELPLFCFAGLWERWHPPEDQSVTPSSTQLDLFPDESFEQSHCDDDIDQQAAQSRETCTILTTAANQKISSLHHRMPVILEKDQHPIWLDRQNFDLSTLIPLFQPLANHLIDFDRIEI